MCPEEVGIALPEPHFQASARMEGPDSLSYAVPDRSLLGTV